MPALVLLLAFALGAIDATLDKLRCVDAARDAALEQARGEDGASLGLAEAPPGATIVITMSGGLAKATITMRTSPLGPRLPGITVTAQAITEIEPGALP